MKFDGKYKARCFTWESYLTGNELKAIKQELINDMIPFCCITHDKEDKVIHTHFMIDYQNPTTFKHISNCYGHLAANGYIQPVLRPEQYYMYLYHDQRIESAKGKYVYDVKDIELYNGFDPRELHNYTESEKQCFMDAIIALVAKYKITEYAGLLEFISEDYRDLYSFAMNNTILVNAYMTSVRNRSKNKECKK